MVIVLNKELDEEKKDSLSVPFSAIDLSDFDANKSDLPYPN